MAMGRKPASNSRSIICICCGVSSTMEGKWTLKSADCAATLEMLGCRGIGFRGRSLKLRQDFPQRGNQLIARNMALLELNTELERLALRLKLKNKRLRPLRSCLFLAPLAARFIACEPALHDAVKHLDHFLFGRLPRNLEQQGLRQDSVLNAFSAQGIRDIAQRHCLRDRRPGAPTFLRAALVLVLNLRSQPVQSIGFFKWRQVLPLNIFDQADFESLRV